jgi:hypothetical protein
LDVCLLLGGMSLLLLGMRLRLLRVKLGLGRCGISLWRLEIRLWRVLVRRRLAWRDDAVRIGLYRLRTGGPGVPGRILLRGEGLLSQRREQHKEGQGSQATAGLGCGCAWRGRFNRKVKMRRNARWAQAGLGFHISSQRPFEPPRNWACSPGGCRLFVRRTPRVGD